MINEPLHGLCNPLAKESIGLYSDFLKHHNNKKETIALWGTSPLSHGFINLLRENNADSKIIAIIDNDETKNGWDYLGIPVISFDALQSEPDVFVIASLMVKSIQCIGEQILNSKYSEVPFIALGNSDGHSWDHTFNIVHQKISNRTIVNKKRLYQLYKLAQFASQQEGSILEFGSYMGGSSYVIASAVAISKYSDNQIIIHDTFQGMPKYSDGYHYEGYLAYPIDAVKALLQEFDNLTVKKCDAVKLRENDIPEKIVFCSIDTDTYQSYSRILHLVYPRMIKGGVLFFDDYYSFPRCAGASIAVNQFFRDKNEVLLFGEGAYIIKQ